MDCGRSNHFNAEDLPRRERQAGESPPERDHAGRQTCRSPQLAAIR